MTWRASRDVAPLHWAGSRLGGPASALYPRASPDGQLVAFVAVVDGLTQVAVTKPGAGNWTVLTKDRTKGLADSYAWSHDGSRIYYDRLTDVHNGIYSVPALGGDERLLIENASSPQPLTDGSLLLLRRNAERLTQLHRLWPDTGQLAPLPALTNLSGYSGGIRQLDAGHIAFFGRPLADAGKANQLHVVALDSGRMTRLGPEVTSGDMVSMAVNAPDRSVFMAVRDGSAFRVLRVPLEDSRPPETALTLLSRPYIDSSPDGALFVGFSDRPYEVLRFRQGNTNVERWATRPTFASGAVVLADGRYLITERVGGTSRVLIGDHAKEPTPLVETTEATRDPFTPLNTEQVALTIGATTPEIAIVAVNSGRILKRLKAPGPITSLAASPDGRMLYVTSDGVVSALPADGGTARTLGPGDSVIVDPDTGALIVKLDEAERYRLVRMSPVDGTSTLVPINSDLRMIPEPLIPGAIRKGRMVLPVATADSWYWFVGVLDMQSGRIEKLPLDYYTDFHFVAWAPDGSIIGSGLGSVTTLWKFAPDTRPTR